MRNLLNNVGKIIKDKSIPIPITTGMFSSILVGQTEKIEEKGIYDVSIQFKEDYIEVTGYAKKLLLNIPFKIELTPSAAEQRILKFEIRNMTPLNQDWIKKKIFNKPPFANYENKLLQIDLNGIEKVKSIPVGQIRNFKIEDNKMWVRIGI